MVSISHKRGATFEYAGNFALPAPSGSWTVRAVLATQDGTVVQALTCVLATITPLSTGENYSLAISATAAQTSAWPLTALLGDIKFTDGAGVVLKTSTYCVNVERGLS